MSFVAYASLIAHHSSLKLGRRVSLADGAGDGAADQAIEYHADHTVFHSSTDGCRIIKALQGFTHGIFRNILAPLLQKLLFESRNVLGAMTVIRM